MYSKKEVYVDDIAVQVMAHAHLICKSGRRRQVRSQLEHRPRLETSVPLDSFDEQKSCRNLSIRAQQVKQCMKIITFNDNDYVSPK